MNVLVLGSGGREHALVHTLKNSKILTNLYCLPGNPGIAQLATCIIGNPLDIAFVDTVVKKRNIQLIIPGSENILLSGIADYYKDSEVIVFGPTLSALDIEASKEFAKNLMMKYHIPTASFQHVTNMQEATNYIKEKGVPIVIKYNGLASGKGVVVATTIEEAYNACYQMLVEKVFGEEGIVIEEFLEGHEFSFMCFVHREMVIPMPIAQDHKRIFDGDLGPMTGGMGVYSPVPLIDEATIDQAFHTIMVPVAKGLVLENREFTGFLYGGLIATSEGPKVIEFNARFGDPEAEVILPKLNSDILEIILLLMANKVPDISWDNSYCLGVVMASQGYPGAFVKNIALPASCLKKDMVFHMGTTIINNQLVSSGGRVLCIVGIGETLQIAKENAYQQLNDISCDMLFYRKDIGHKSLN